MAIVLLGFYGYAIKFTIETAACLNNPQSCSCDDFPECTRPPGNEFNRKYSRELKEPYSSILTLVGGLVSALVIAALAVAPPQETIGLRLVSPSSSALTQRIVTIVAAVYVAVWFICGVALIVGWIKYSDKVPALDAAAKSWLGLAVAATYSYLGIKPDH